MGRGSQVLGGLVAARRHVVLMTAEASTCFAARSQRQGAAYAATGAGEQAGIASKFLC
jgi:hypothetical protein